MLVPMLIGYVVGAVGIYTLLYKLSPMVTEDRVTQLSASGMDGRVEIIDLFSGSQTSDDANGQRKAA